MRRTRRGQAERRGRGVARTRLASRQSETKLVFARPPVSAPYYSPVSEAGYSLSIGGKFAPYLWKQFCDKALASRIHFSGNRT